MCAAAVASPLGIPIEKNDHLLPPITPLFSLLTTELRLLLLSLFNSPRPRCPIIHMRCDDDDAGRTVEVVLGPAAPCAGADAASPRPCDERAAATAATLRGATRALGVELRCVDTRETDPITVGVARDLRRRRLLPGWQARRGAAADVAVSADRDGAGAPALRPAARGPAVRVARAAALLGLLRAAARRPAPRRRDGFAPPPGDGRLHATLALGSWTSSRAASSTRPSSARPVVAAAAALPDYAAVYALDGVRLGEKARRPDGARRR
ncbi:ubiquitin-protein transferase [Aureococcus anophagefferens]|nr:ubiquitin-protein transferase [Aureococcus anophagefferens]